MAEPTVAAGLARGLWTLAVSKGADPAALAERSGLDPRDLEDQDARTPFSAYVALMRAGQNLTGDTALAFSYAEAVDMSEFSVVGLIADAAATMREAFVQLNRYARLVVEVEGVDGEGRFRFERRGGDLWLIDRRSNPNDFPELTESTFARMTISPRRFGDTPFVKAVRVTHPEPPHRAEYDRIFRAPVTFGCEENALLIESAWTDRPVARLPRYVFNVLSERADALLERLKATTTTRGRVENLLLPVLHTGEFSMQAVAAALGLSRQTLFRRLKAEGVTFGKALDDLRLELALDYLDGRKVSVTETAYLVGFSDRAAFSRAFKRWTGRTPRG